MTELLLSGAALTVDSLAAATRRSDVQISLADGVEPRLVANAELASTTSKEHALYGRTTGVGANRDTAADDSDGEHGRRLLRSHTAGFGPVLADEIGRALLIVRANQLAGARSGIAPHVVVALLEALRRNLTPVVRRHGGVGTGDITVLAELGLALVGERPWSNGKVVSLVHDIDASGALPLMSSSAPTVAVAALAVHDAQRLSNAMLVIASLSAIAVRANPEAWSEVGAASRAHPGMVHVGATLRALVRPSTYSPLRLQDPFAWRCLVPVQGALHDVVNDARCVVEIDCNASCENPLYTDSGSWHHGGFHHGRLALTLDQLRLAMVQAAGLSLSRLTHLHDPAMTGLRQFLAEGPEGSSGTMVLEYTAASAIADLRQWAAPATLGHTVVSRGIEDHASFAWQAALATRFALVSLRSVMACELVAAIRAVRRQGSVPSTGSTPEIVALCQVIPDGAVDHVLVDDLLAADSILDRLAGVTGQT